MAATPLATIYATICTAFNGASAQNAQTPANIQTLMDAMADDVTLKKVLHPNAVLGGKDTVQSYLAKDMFTTQPSFTPTANTVNYHYDKGNEGASTIANVRGLGTYTDDTTVAHPVVNNIAFIWSFKRNATGDEWKLVNVFGCPVDNNGF